MNEPDSLPRGRTVDLDAPPPPSRSPSPESPRPPALPEPAPSPLPNRALIFRRPCPDACPVLGDHWTLEPYPEPSRAIVAGEILVQLRFVSVDPYMHNRMCFPSSSPDRNTLTSSSSSSSSSLTSISSPSSSSSSSSSSPLALPSPSPSLASPSLRPNSFQIGHPGASHVVVEVLLSTLHPFPVGATFATFARWIDRQTLRAHDLAHCWPVPRDVPPSASLGVLGMPGATAYFGYLRVCRPAQGETLVVSGAAGAVGSLVCQLGKIAGCRVVGVAGSAAKCAYLAGLGCDAAVDYHDADWAEQLRRAAPRGVDQYFDNVGGAIKDAVFALLNPRARVACCGAISSYQMAQQAPASACNWEAAIIAKQLRIEGFVSSRWIAEWPEAFERIAQWIREGKIKYEETLEYGMDHIVTAFNKLMRGANTGKMVVVI